MAVTDNRQRRVQFGFKLGGIVTLIGLGLRVAAPHLSWDSIGDGAWNKNEDALQMWTDVSLAATAFGLVVLVVSLNRWLHLDDSHTEEGDHAT